MKKTISILLVLAMCLGVCLAGCGQPAGNENTGNQGADFVVGVCQLMKHDSLDQATKGFTEALTAAITAAGKTVDIDTQVAGGAELCTTVINTFTSKNVDLIMANATPALVAAANATENIPILGTSVTDYNDTFSNNIPANVTGTSDAVPFDEQAQMMMESLGLVSGDKVGVLYCSNESNSLFQYEAVKPLFEQEGIVVEAYTFSEITEMQAVVNAASDACKAIFVPSDNTVSENETIVSNICNEKKVPVYTSYGGKICYASLAIDYYELGKMTGTMAAQILLGEKTVADISIQTLTPTVQYNTELCAELGIEVPEN